MAPPRGGRRSGREGGARQPSGDGSSPAGAAYPRGRGAGGNPRGRFERLALDRLEPAPTRVETRFLVDSSRSIIAENDSPDVGFDASINPYRGCEHGCAYCYARPTHEYLGYSAGLDFETRILVKHDAPELLERQLASRGWRPRVVGISGVTDPYQPVERRLALTRRCLEVLAACRNPVAVVTKNALVTRDIDVLAPLARRGAAAVFLSVTTLDRDLARRLEPRTSTPERRLAAMTELAAAGIPTGVLVAPVIPALTDHEMPSILAAAAAAGAARARWVLLRLPGAVAGLFESWLERHEPGRRAKVLGRIRDLRGGRLNDSRFHRRGRGEGVFAAQLRALFVAACRRHGLDWGPLELSTAAFQRPGGEQLELA